MYDTKFPINLMGILRNGYYTRGYKTTEEIYDLTGMRYGDTVFDTTRKERLIYDGNVWVSGNMIGKIWGGSSINTGGITYTDTAKCGQMVGYLSNQYMVSVNWSTFVNVENGIGIMQFPINKSYGDSSVRKVAVQYSGQAYVWANNTGSFVGQFVTAVPSVLGGTAGNYYIWAGRAGKDVTSGIGQVGVWTVAPTNVVISSDTTPKGYTGTIPIGKAFIRFGETN